MNQKIKFSFTKNTKLFELDFTKNTPLYQRRTNVLKSKTFMLNPQNEGRLAGAKQRGMSRQMRKRPK